MVHEAQFDLPSLKNMKFFLKEITKWHLCFVSSVTTSQLDGIVGVHNKTSAMNE